MRLPARPAAWLDRSVGNRLTSASVVTAVALVMLLGAAAFPLFLLQSRENFEGRLQNDLDRMADRLDFRLSAVEQSIGQLVKNSFVANGLADSTGREIYLQPTLRDFRLPFGIASTLILFDANLTPIAGTKPDFLNRGFEHGRLARAALNEEKPHIALGSESGRRVMTLAFPVFYPPSSAYEGVLLAIVDAEAVFQVARHGDEAGCLTIASGGAPFLVFDCEATERGIGVSRPLLTQGQLGGDSALSVVFSKPPTALHRQLAIIFALYFVLGAAAVAAAYLFSRRAGRQFADQLDSLARASRVLADNPSAETQVAWNRPDEIGRFADAFNQMVKALQASRSEAEVANSAKSRFLAAASHDLRQPLSALTLYVGVLQGRIGPADKELLAKIKDCIGSLSELLTDLLDLSKLEAGVVKPNRDDFRLDDVLASLLAVHEAEAQLKGLRLRLVASGITAYTDPILFKRILGNLIDNAIRYTERGGVLVGCRRSGGKTWIEVWDTGLGIPQDKTAEIFEEFKQLGDQARTRGSGLGLAIAAKTAAVLGLAIRVRSRPGRGSVFALELPLGQERAIPAATPGHLAPASIRVALVEDNAMLRQALAESLQAKGHQVVAAATGAQLMIELGGLPPPDIVVSDYRLAQGETGFDVIKAVRSKLGADLPAILITGDTDPDLVRSMAGRGITVLHKPLNVDTLQVFLKNLTCPQEALAG